MQEWQIMKALALEKGIVEKLWRALLNGQPWRWGDMNGHKSDHGATTGKRNSEHLMCTVGRDMNVLKEK